MRSMTYLRWRTQTLIRGLPARFHWATKDAASLLLSRPLLPSGARRRLYRLMGHRIDSRISPLVRLVGTKRLTIGRGGFVNTECLFDLSDDIHIGDRVHLGPRVCIYTSTHQLGPLHCRAGELQRAPVHVGDGCWLGANVIVLPGVRLVAGVVVAAGAVVTTNLDRPGLYAGVPAKYVHSLDQGAARPAVVKSKAS